MPLSNLNEEQKAAATAPLGANLVIASAGTGKTSTIVARIAHLINSKLASPDEILLLTFTNKASQEMLFRVSKIFGADVASQIRSGTFHSVAYKWLKSLNENVTLKAPNELRVLFKSVYEPFLRGKNMLLAKSLLDYYELWQNTGDESFGDWLEAKNKDHAQNTELYLQALAEYEKTKQDLGFVSFNDLLLLLINKLSSAPAPYKEVLVDEYQDTNPLQNKLIGAINPPSLFCVGDYDQSIYAFNGAQIKIISTFTQRYAGARVFTLEKNYRSTSPILSLANRVIENNERIYPKKLSVVRQDAPSAPTLLEFGDLISQYETIALKIKQSAFRHEHIAVIFRNNSSADGIEAMLRQYGIACKRRGGNSFFEAREIRLVLDLLTLFVNSKDLLAFIGVCELAKTIGVARSKEIYSRLLQINPKGIRQALLDPQANDSLFSLETHFGGIDAEFSTHPVLNLKGLQEEGALFLNELFVLFKAGAGLDLLALLDLVAASPIFTRAREQLAKTRATKNHILDEDLYEAALGKIDVKINTLKRLAGHYESLSGFLNALILGGREMTEGSGVNLLTVHSSKGLEFEEVFVIDLMDMRFPNKKLISMGGSLEEERRLFYVAVTRAKQSLFLSYAKSDSYKKISYKPSQFLIEAGLKNSDALF
ncbi:MAG: ATP-dependent helicase [Helicobacteraceae bacterium]